MNCVHMVIGRFPSQTKAFTFSTFDQHCINAIKKLFVCWVSSLRRLVLCSSYYSRDGAIVLTVYVNLVYHVHQFLLSGILTQ